MPLSFCRVESTDTSSRKWSRWPVISTRCCNMGFIGGGSAAQAGSTALENDVPHPVAQPQTAVFELVRAIVWLGRVAFSRIGQQGLLAQHFKHLLCIGLPVGGAVQIPAGLEACRQLWRPAGSGSGGACCAFSCARVWKENVDAIQAAWGQHVVNDLRRRAGGCECW